MCRTLRNYWPNNLFIFKRILIYDWIHFNCRWRLDSMVTEIKLSNCVISENDYPFIIAEIGNNHNGDMTVLKDL